MFGRDTRNTSTDKQQAIYRPGSHLAGGFDNRGVNDLGSGAMPPEPLGGHPEMVWGICQTVV